MKTVATLVCLGCLALAYAAPAEQEQGPLLAGDDEMDSYRMAAEPQIPLTEDAPPHDPEGPDHALAPPPADHVAPAARTLAFVQQEQQPQEELIREKRQFGYGGYGGGYGRRGFGRRHHGFGRYPGGYGGGYGGYPGGYGGYGGYPGGYGGYGGYPGGGFGGSSANSAAQASSFSIGGGFGPFQGSLSSSQASSNAGSFGFGR